MPKHTTRTAKRIVESGASTEAEVNFMLRRVGDKTALSVMTILRAEKIY